MGVLPIPAKRFFDDFSFDLVDCDIKRNSKNVGRFKGLYNKDEGGQHIAFLIDADVKSGDVLTVSNNTFVVKCIEYDHYNGSPELLKAYY